MAAVTFTKARPMTPVGYENIGRTEGGLLSAVTAGQLLVEGSSGWDLAATTAKMVDGIALQDGGIGEVIDVGLIGEMDLIGATLTAGADYYPSGSVAGGIDSTAATWYSVATTPAVAVPVTPQMHGTKVGKRVVLRYCFI